MTVGIIGFGWVGKAMYKLFPDALVYDSAIDEGWLNPDTGAINNKSAYQADVVFICVPTPNLPDGSLDTSIVEKCADECTPNQLVVIRSTVNPGTADQLAERGLRVVIQPEYLGETPNHPFSDMTTRPFIIIGGDRSDCRQLIELYATVYNANVSIRQVTALEAEVIKLSENRAIAFKVAQCQELYDACEKAGVDYYTIRDAVYGDDPRMNLWWTFIYPGKRGFNSKCIPKDVYAWAAWAESVGYKPVLTRSMLEVNDALIRSNP